MRVEPIGRIQTPFTNKRACPIQPAAAAEAVGQVEVFAPYVPGLKDIEIFSHVFLLYHFDRAGPVELVRPTFLDDEPHGVFASRHPCRPNGIGLSIVRLVERRGPLLIVTGVDMLDGTPLLDIKPYVPRFDVISDATNGWVESRPWRPKPEGRQ